MIRVGLLNFVTILTFEFSGRQDNEVENMRNEGSLWSSLQPPLLVRISITIENRVTW